MSALGRLNFRKVAFPLPAFPSSEATKPRPDVKFFYVCILRSESHPDRRYVRFTENPEKRPQVHRNGRSHHTAKFRPWFIKTTVAFTDRERALSFERYLKSSAGRAFAKKRL